MIYTRGTPTDLDRPFVLFDNLWTQGTLSAVGAWTDVANTGNGNTFDFATGPLVLSAIDLNLAAPAAADCLVVSGHSLGSSTSTWTVQYSDDDVTFTALASIAPTNDNTAAVIFTEVTKRYWRFTLASTSTAPQISTITLGKRLIIPGYVAAPYTPSWGAKRVELLGGVSRGGQFLGNRVKRLGATFQVGFNPLDEAWVSDDARAFIDHYNEGKPFAFASGPSDFPEDIAYCWRAGDELRPSFREDGPYMDFGLNVEAYVEP